ncbi:alcohol dehydrogenase catalytic domain-containing protein [Streptomyces sp. NBC_01361]|uniref:alcohol dehydrogenase catalytic domain-containing protein n=1 Tax=Streptomyces sp. NBC_01361 TaxID=2903838 RepID=UPI002E2EB7D6|nr:hypothetical protein [Streptomyces sp. NBC_01361]
MLAAADPTAGGSGKQYQAGYEFAGEVTAVGDGADTITVGQRVMGTTPASFAQYVPVDHRHALPIPNGLGNPQACALPTGLFTEHGALMTGTFRPGQSVLITGATSSIGLIGLQIARALLGHCDAGARHDAVAADPRQELALGGRAEAAHRPSMTVPSAVVVRVRP